MKPTQTLDFYVIEPSDPDYANAVKRYNRHVEKQNAMMRRYHTRRARFFQKIFGLF